MALDDTQPALALRMARSLRGLAGTVKVGSALFTAAGPDVIRRLQGLGFRVMLDLKFHDIPSTVELACRAAAGHGAALLTVHAAGGRAMLEAAVRGAAAGRGARPRVLAVTVLTSAGARDAARVPALAAEALRAGCDGLVASAREAARLRRRFGATPWIVCPGIRPSGAGGDDQQRICTPAQALAAGADALVVGRPITASFRPRAAAEAILREMEGGCGC